MEFQVNTNQVILRQQDQVESGEYNVTECNFIFSSEFDGLTKKAVFTGEDGTAYLQTIVNNKCSIPSEILEVSQVVEIGVYAYDVENEELVLRYSPEPTQFYIHQGSYKEAQNSTPPTPSEIEQLQAQITTNANNIEEIQGDIAGINQELVGINGEILGINRDIDDIKAEQTEQNTKIQKNTDDIVEINQNINEIDSHINAINEDIDNLEQDLTNYSLITETGSQINLNINSTNYQITAILKDKNGNVIYTSNAIDLPIESMIVNARYDNTTKEIVLTLQNGNTLRISVADLISGLVSETQLQTILANYYTKTEVDNLLSAKANQSSLDATNQNLSNLAGRVSTNETDIADIKQEQTTQNTNIEELQNQVETLQEDLESANSEIEELNTDITNMAKAMYKVDGQGSDITLQNTSENKFVEFGLEGRTEQTQLEGYNLLEVTNVYEQTILNGVTIKTNQDGTITLNGTATANMDVNFMGTNPLTEIELEANQNYILSKKVISGSVSRIMIAYYLAGATSTFTTDTKDLGSNTDIRTLQNCRIFVNSGDVFNNVTVGLMLLKGSTDKNWEPYCGGIPAPNPIYKIPIKNVTGNANEKIQNKNLLPNNLTWQYGYVNGSGGWAGDYTHKNAFSDYIYLKAGTYTISYEIATTIISIAKYNTSKVFIERDQTIYAPNTSKNKTFTLNQDGYIRISHYDDTGSQILDNINSEKNQIEIGSTATSYVPHAEQNLPFTFASGQFLADNGELKDSGIYNEFQEIIFDGTENILVYESGDNYDGFAIKIKNTYLANAGERSTQKYNYFMELGHSASYGRQPNKATMGTDGYLYVFFEKNVVADVTAVRNWLATKYANGNPLIAIGKVKNPISIPYNSTQQAQYEAIKNARSYADKTIITSTSDELGFDMNVVAIGDANKVIDTQNNEIDTIKSRLDLLEG